MAASELSEQPQEAQACAGPGHPSAQLSAANSAAAHNGGGCARLAQQPIGDSIIGSSKATAAAPRLKEAARATVSRRHSGHAAPHGTAWSGSQGLRRRAVARARTVRAGSGEERRESRRGRPGHTVPALRTPATLRRQSRWSRRGRICRPDDDVRRPARPELQADRGYGGEHGRRVRSARGRSHPDRSPDRLRRPRRGA